MSTLLDYYKVLGISVGAGIADLTSSYKRLCRIYHPDVSGDPESEELMKKINIAYTVLRERLRREAAFRERSAHYRPARRYAHTAPDEQPTSATARRTGAEAERAAYSAIHGYFNAISAYDYSGAYDYISAYDKRQISRESFIDWRISVSRLYPMRKFTVESKSTMTTVTFNDDKILLARKFQVVVTEENVAEKTTGSDGIEKLVVNEDGEWRVFLGYGGVYELTRVFDERFEDRRKRDIAKKIKEYYGETHPEYNMLSLAGMRKSVSRELYRQKRFGGALTFASISVKAGGARGAGQEELQRSAAETIGSALRETDIPAYVGDGVFAILFVELRKKDAEVIIGRLAEDIRADAGPQLGGRAEIEYTFESWSDGSYADTDTLNKVLKKFRKKL